MEDYQTIYTQYFGDVYKYLLSLCREPENQALPPDSPEESLLRKESAFALHRILHTLPEPYKEVFSLRVLGELSFRQIGILFGKTENWARVTYHRARPKIKEELQ